MLFDEIKIVRARAVRTVANVLAVRARLKVSRSKFAHFVRFQCKQFVASWSSFPTESTRERSEGGGGVIISGHQWLVLDGMKI